MRIRSATLRSGQYDSRLLTRACLRVTGPYFSAIVLLGKVADCRRIAGIIGRRASGSPRVLRTRRNRGPVMVKPRGKISWPTYRPSDHPRQGRIQRGGESLGCGPPAKFFYVGHKIITRYK